MRTTSRADSRGLRCRVATGDAPGAVRHDEWLAFQRPPLPVPAWRIAAGAVLVGVVWVGFLVGSPAARWAITLGGLVVLLGARSWLGRRRAAMGSPRWHEAPPELEVNLSSIQRIWVSCAVIGAVAASALIEMLRGHTYAAPAVGGAIAMVVFLCGWCGELAVRRAYRRWFAGRQRLGRVDP